MHPAFDHLPYVVVVFLCFFAFPLSATYFCKQRLVPGLVHLPKFLWLFILSSTTLDSSGNNNSANLLATFREALH